MSGYFKINDSGKNNSFGFLRLLFASLVIVSHTPELMDGDRGREILTRLLGGISFGELSVDSFFIISGFLITKSFVFGGCTASFLIKRVGRIYPAYIVAFLFSVWLVPLWAGASIPRFLHRAIKELKKIPFLSHPGISGVFEGSYYDTLNGAMWTLQYEFVCYLLVVALGILGVLSSRKAILIIFSALIVLFSVNLEFSAYKFEYIRLFCMFLSGSVAFVFRENIRFTKIGFISSLTLLIIGLSCGKISELFVPIFLPYIILYIAFFNKIKVLRSVNSKTDLSYGIYLYSWPIEKLILWYYPSMNILMVGALDFVVAASCALLSWFYIERPSLNFSHRLANYVKKRKAVAVQ